MNVLNCKGTHILTVNNVDSHSCKELLNEMCDLDVVKIEWAEGLRDRLDLAQEAF